ncbi:hypothetical protein, partial [Bartonella sp. CL45QHWL]|uniref:hypothetical protein n=1 Tax=Bartonella sp. CL45QHWL TaxID=3243533 RepID=UPI0035CEE70F
EVMKSQIALTHFHDLLTYFKTGRQKGVVFNIGLNVMKNQNVLTYFHDLLTHLNTGRPKRVVFAIKLKKKMRICQLYCMVPLSQFGLQLISAERQALGPLVNKSQASNS